MSQTEVRACALPAPDDEEVETLLRTVVRWRLRDVKLPRARGKLADAAPCEDALGFLRARAVREQQRLPLGEGPRTGHQRWRCAFLEGFSLHADTWVHRNNRERLATFGARGPLSLARLSHLADGRLCYRTQTERDGDRVPYGAGAVRSYDGEMKLPGWVIDNQASVEREAAPWRDRTDAERALALVAVCRAAGKILEARTDRQRVYDWVDPLPAHSVAALRRLRQQPR